VGFDFGLPSLVTFFGGAKKVTTLMSTIMLRHHHSDKPLFSLRFRSLNPAYRRNAGAGLGVFACPPGEIL